MEKQSGRPAVASLFSCCSAPACCWQRVRPPTRTPLRALHAVISPTGPLQQVHLPRVARGGESVHSSRDYQAPEKWGGGEDSCCRPLKGLRKRASLRLTCRTNLGGVADLLPALCLLENLCLPGHSPLQLPPPYVPGFLDLWQRGSREETQTADFPLWCTEGQDFHRGTWPKALLPHRACPLEGKERKGRGQLLQASSPIRGGLLSHPCLLPTPSQTPTPRSLCLGPKLAPSGRSPSAFGPLNRPSSCGAHPEKGASGPRAASQWKQANRPHSVERIASSPEATWLLASGLPRRRRRAGQFVATDRSQVHLCAVCIRV